MSIYFIPLLLTKQLITLSLYKKRDHFLLLFQLLEILSDPSTWLAENPDLTADDAEILLYQLYGLKARCVKERTAEVDKVYHVHVHEAHSNPHLQTVCNHGYILKVVNTKETRINKVGKMMKI